MPNWVRGDLKIRGTEANIKNFLLENLIQDDRKIYEGENELILISGKGFQIKDTQDGCALNMITFNFSSNEKIEKYELNKFRAFGQIRPEPYLRLSNKYAIDIEMDAVEYNSGFYQNIEIRNGKIIKNEFIGYYIDDCGKKQSLRSEVDETFQESKFLDMWL